jgi:hypothetical protein
MKNWLRKHFQDEDHTRETIAITGFIVGTIGAMVSFIALTFPHWVVIFR